LLEEHRRRAALDDPIEKTKHEVAAAFDRAARGAAMTGLDARLGKLQLVYCRPDRCDHCRAWGSRVFLKVWAY
jgi:hypothetical protein